MSPRRLSLGMVWMIAATWVCTLPSHAQSVDSFDPAANGAVNAIAVQEDGSILVGGAFSTLGGQWRSSLARLRPDGAVDPTFTATASSTVNCLAIQTNGMVLVAGSFSTLGGQPHLNIGRISADGTLDASFTAAASNTVNAIALQPDGSIVVGGSFRGLAGQVCNRFGRLTPAGAFDFSFTGTANGTVYALALQADGALLVGGTFNTLAGYPCTRIGRCDANGNFDVSFNASADGTVYCVAVQPDGKVLIGGSFQTLSGAPCARIGRLNVDGSIDGTFSAGASNSVYSTALQADGRIIVSGDFTNLCGVPCNRIGRLNADGSFDSSFNPGASGSVAAIALQPDGKVLLGGTFTNVAGAARTNLCRLNNTGAAIQSLTFSSGAIRWSQGGCAPAWYRVALEASTNKTGWEYLGEAMPADGAWHADAQGLPPSASIRARGFVPGGRYNGSTWFQDAWTGRAVVLGQPVSRTNDAATLANFSAVVEGSGLTYQWLKDGVPLPEMTGIVGAQTASLTLSNVLGADAGGYSLVITNQFGSVTSGVATLTVIDPVITLQPRSQIANQGSSVTLAFSAAGTAPLRYQWLKGATNVAGGVTPNLTLPAASRADADVYQVIVTNVFGSATSVVATLSVNLAPLDLAGFGAMNPYNNVPTFALQPDNKILVAGYFYPLNSGATGCARLLGDGSSDPTFAPTITTVGDSAYCVAVQEDEKILVSDVYYSVYRYRSDGYSDTSFRNGCNYALAMALQADGKILLGGAFTGMCNQSFNRVARLNTDGTLESGFNPGPVGPSSYGVPKVVSIALQRDGAIVVGGTFDNLAGQTRMNIGRINADGSIDASFTPAVGGTVNCVVVQPDGKIIVAGAFTNLVGLPCNSVGRLNSDGSADPTFRASPGVDPSGAVNSVAVQADGKILLGGSFTNVNGLERLCLARLNADGTLDLTFAPSADYVSGLALQTDGAILVAGCTTLSGQASGRVGRLKNTDPATQSLSVSGSTVTWLRGGTSPQLWRAAFDVSTNGVDWSRLGEGTPISNGWELAGVVISSNSIVRARGFIMGGQRNGSCWFVESRFVAGQRKRPAILVQDPGFGFTTNQFGFRIDASPGDAVAVEASTDPAIWTSLVTTFVGTNPPYFCDPGSKNMRCRLYRLRAQ